MHSWFISGIAIVSGAVAMVHSWERRNKPKVSPIEKVGLNDSATSMQAEVDFADQYKADWENRSSSPSQPATPYLPSVDPID